MLRVLTLAVSVGLLLPAGATAATIKLDRSCYVAGQEGELTLSGFTPNAPVTVSSPDLGSTTLTVDAAGAGVLPVSPPSEQDDPHPGSRRLTVTATEDAKPANTAFAKSRVAPLSFSSGSGTSSPTATRTWSFSGFTTGKPIYGHFRFAGKTRGTFRFGVATGSCGELDRRAAGIITDAGRVATGTWTIQVDQRRSYSAKAPTALRGTTRVVATTSRSARLAAATQRAAAVLRTF